MPIQKAPDLLKTRAWECGPLLTCSAGVSAQRGGSPQRCHGRRAAHALHRPQLAMLHAGSSGRGAGGVQEPGGGRGERRDGGGRRRGRGGQGGIGGVLARLLLDDGELKERAAAHRSAARLSFAPSAKTARRRLSQDPVRRCATLPDGCGELGKRASS